MSNQQQLLERARKVSTAVYLAADKEPADDISECIRDLIAEIERLSGHMGRLGEEEIEARGPNDLEYDTNSGDISFTKECLFRNLQTRIQYARDNRYEDKDSE